MIDAVIDRSVLLEERFAVGRATVGALVSAEFVGFWIVGSMLDDVEFVDRYLYVWEISYIVSELFSML